MPLPVATEDVDYQTLSWTLNYIPTLKHQNYAIPDHELPYIQYKVIKVKLNDFNIDEKLTIENWYDLNKVLARDDYDYVNKSKGLEAYFNSFKSKLDTLNNMGKVKYFVEKINSEFKIADFEDDDNMLKPVMYFVENKKIDINNLRSFYKYMFYYLKIPYESCFGKSRYRGDLFPEIISTHQISHVFFSFADEQGGKHYLFLSTADVNYHVDERPFSLEGTQAIFLKKENPFTEDKPVSQFNYISQTPAETNIRTITSSYNINTDWSSATCDARVSYSGMLSTLFRNTWTSKITDYDKKKWIEWLDQEENKGFSLDTVFIEQNESEYPFKFVAKMKSGETDIITNTADKMASLKIQAPLQHKIIESNSYSRIADLYLPYMYSDELIYFVRFPSPVNVINEKELVREVSNKAGAFKMTINKVSDSIYKISSVYSIKTRKLLKEDYKALVDLNEMVEQTKEINLLFKKL